MNGRVPNGWVVTTIGAVCASKVEQRTPSSTFSYVDIGSVDNHHKVISRSTRLTPQEAPSRARQVLHIGDVLVSLTRPNLNAVALVPDHLNGAIGSTGFAVLRPRACEPGWLLAFVRHPEFVSRMTGLVQGALYPAVRPSDVRETPIVLPPLGEQRRIVAKLEALQARSRRAREALDAVPPLLEKLRQSILAAAFRGDLTKDWRAQNPNTEPASALLARIRTERRKKWEEAELAKLKAKGKTPTDDRWKAKYKEPEPVDTTGLPELPEGWCWASLDALTLLAGGLTKGQKRSSSAVLHDVPYLRVANVQRGHLTLEEVKTIAATDEEIAELRLLPGDILLNEGGDRDKLGRGWVWEGQIATCVHQNHVFRARPVSNDLESKYISHYANQRGQEFFVDQGKQTTNLASVSMSRVRRLPVALPPALEQSELVRLIEQRFNEIARVVEHAARLLEQSELLGSSLLSKAFRGELVPQDPNDEPAEALLSRLRADSASEPPRARKRRNKAAE